VPLHVWQYGDARRLEHQVDVAGDTAVVTFRYDMVYERSGERFHSTGRDLWVFQNQGGAWITSGEQFDMEENTALPSTPRKLSFAN